MPQQTAMEWLKMKLEDENSQNEYIDPLNPDKISFKYIMFLLDCALEKEKEQIMKAVDRGFDEGCKFPEDMSLSNSEQYYNETYNK